MNAAKNATTAPEFVPTTVGLNYAEVNLINWASRVQVYQGTLGRFYVAVPTTARHTGIRAVSGHATLSEAIAAAAPVVEKQTVRMNRIHAAANKINASL